MKKIMYLLCLGLVLSACDKREEYTPSTTIGSGADALGDITPPTNFNWSSSTKGNLALSLNAPSNMITNGAPVVLVDGSGKVVDRTNIFNNEAEFYFIIPQNNSELSVMFPNTGESMSISTDGNVSLTVGQEDRTVERDSTYYFSGKKGKSASNISAKTLADLMVNGDFSVNDFGYLEGDYDVLRTSGKWYEGSAHGIWTTSSGNEVYKSTENSNSKWAVVVQSVVVAANSSYSASFDYSGNSSHVAGYIDFFDSNGGHLGYDGFSENNGSGTTSGTTPSNCAYAQVYLTQKKKGYVDNVIFDATTPIADADNDGVPDDQDDYPNDPARAYTSYFPSSGYQTLAFEDLWPAKGDFDFNDMVVSTDVVYTLDANNDKVDATFTISLDAAGAGFSNGLAVVFTDGSKQFIGQNIITSVTGDASLDPSVTNGIIVFNDVFTSQSEYYQNNGVGPSLAADVFTFTVSFNANASSQTIIPDIYIFRTDNRGSEVHLSGFVGTSAADVTLNGTIDDVAGTYKTANGLPWALEMITATKDFDHPIEKVDIVNAYPDFQGWAESDGSLNTTWLDNSVSGNVFQ